VGEDWFEPALNTHTPMHNSVTFENHAKVHTNKVTDIPHTLDHVLLHTGRDKLSMIPTLAFF
jgi:hypothetical protein